MKNFRFNRSKNKLIKKEKILCLEVLVRDGTPTYEIDAIAQALATIGQFFGARVEKGGGGSGSGGKPAASIRRTPMEPAHPNWSQVSIVPPPIGDSGPRVGDRP